MTRLITEGNQVKIVQERVVLSMEELRERFPAAEPLPSPVAPREESCAAMIPTETPALTQEGSV